MRSDPKNTRVFDKENPSLSAKDALSLLRAPLAPEGQPDSPSTLQAHEAAVAKRFAATPTLPARRAPLTPKSPNPAARTPVTPAAGFSRTTEDFDLSFNSAGAGSTPGTALSQNKKSAAGDSAEPSPSRRGGAAPRRRPSPVLESSPTAFHARMGRDADFANSAQSTGGAFSPTVRNAVNAASIVLAAAATTPGNKVTHPTPANTPAARAFPPADAVRREEERDVETDVEEDVEMNVKMNVEKTDDVSENQSSPSEEAVIEEVRSWFASVHSKLDVALSAISPAPARATSVSPPYGSTRTPARAPTLPGSSAGLTSTPVEALSVFPRAASGVMYPTPALASADDLRDEARRAAKALADAAIAALTEREEARDAPVPNAPGLDSGIEAVVAPEAPEVVPGTAVVPETPNEPELADREEVATPEPKRAAVSIASNENHLDARLSTPPRAPPLVSPPPSSPAVGHTAHDALAMTPETLRVVAMVTCAALLSGYTIAITVFSLATVMNAAAAAAAAVWRAVAVWGARGPAPAEAVRCVMRGAFSIYPPGLARLVLAAEAALGDALDALRGAGGAGASEGVPESYGAFESYEEPTAFEDWRIVTLTWEGVALLFFVVTTATLVAGGAALFFAGADGDALETLATAVSPGTRRVLSRVMEAVSPVSPAGARGRERARLRSTFF